LALPWQTLRLKCTKFAYRWGSPADPLAGFKGPTSKGRDGIGAEGKGGGKIKGGKGNGGGWRDLAHPKILA